MLDARGLLTTLLSGAGDMARKGETAAADRLGVGQDAASREGFRKGALGGAAAAGALSLLLGTKTGREIGSTGLAVGGLAALAKVAYDAWGRHQAAAEATPEGAAAPPPLAPPVEAAGEDAKARALLSAMVAAAKSDGHVDEAEMAAIREHLAPLGAEAQEFLIAELARPLDARVVAGLAPDSQTAREMVALTAALIDPDDAPEAAWLEALSDALGVPPAMRVDLQRGIAAAG